MKLCVTCMHHRFEQTKNYVTYEAIGSHWCYAPARIKQCAYEGPCEVTRSDFNYCGPFGRWHEPHRVEGEANES